MVANESGKPADNLIGSAIARARQGQRLSQERLAQLAGVSRVTIGNIETGRSLGRALRPVAEVLGLSYDDLLAGRIAAAGQPPALADIPTDVLATELARRLTTPPAARHRYDVDMGDGTTVTVLADHPLDPAEREHAAAATRARRTTAPSHRD